MATCSSFGIKSQSKYFHRTNRTVRHMLKYLGVLVLCTLGVSLVTRLFCPPLLQRAEQMEDQILRPRAPQREELWVPMGVSKALMQRHVEATEGPAQLGLSNGLASVPGPQPHLAAGQVGFASGPQFPHPDDGNTIPTSQDSVTWSAVQRSLCRH